MKIIFRTLLAVVVLYVISALWLSTHVLIDNRGEADAVLVLGSRAYWNNTYNPCLVSRVKHGVDLANSGAAKQLIVSGGIDREDGVVESRVMKQLAVGMGLAPEKIIVEASSSSTYENIKNSHVLMKNLGISNVILVTEPFHMPRASMVAAKQGIEYRVSPATDSVCWTRWQYFSIFFLEGTICDILVLDTWKNLSEYHYLYF